MAKWLVLPAVLLCGFLLIVSCSNKDDFAQNPTTDYFVQNSNPNYLDVLWMIDDRSDLSYYASTRNQVLSQAQTFFTRLDQTANINYRMGIVDGNAGSNGALLPIPNGQILTKGLGTVTQRVDAFTSIIGQIINLDTSATMSGLENALSALTSTFVPRTGVPLVLVFISDTQDHSVVPAGASTTDPVTYYSNAYLQAVGGNQSMLQVFNVNYVPGETSFCATSQQNDDNPSNYENNFWQVATALGGQSVDLCGAWGSTISLQGLAQGTLNTTFQLSANPNLNKITITIFDASGNSYPVPTYTINSTTDLLTFSTPPAANTTIEVQYFPAN